MGRAWVIALLHVSGCGRVAFDALSTDASNGDAFVCVAPKGHDEDGDDVDDACDTCPHLAGAQLDTDTDGIGDACDPEPSNSRQRVELFATMQPGDMPFVPVMPTVWTQLADSYHYDGNGYGGITTPVQVANTIVAMGFAVTGHTNGPDVQHQLEIFAATDDGTFVQFGFNATGVANVPDATIAYFDGVSYASYLTMPTASGLHAGPLTISGTYLIGQYVSFDGGWPGESYHLELDPFTTYTGGTMIKLDSNNVDFAVEWVHVITW